MKIFIFGLLALGCTLTQSASLSTKIEKNDKSKPETSKHLKNLKEDQKNLKLVDTSDVKEADRAKKSCKIVNIHGSPTKVCMEIGGSPQAVQICDNENNHMLHSNSAQSVPVQPNYYMKYALQSPNEPNQGLNPSTLESSGISSGFTNYLAFNPSNLGTSESGSINSLGQIPSSIGSSSIGSAGSSSGSSIYLMQNPLNFGLSGGSSDYSNSLGQIPTSIGSTGSLSGSSIYLGLNPSSGSSWLPTYLPNNPTNFGLAGSVGYSSTSGSAASGSYIMPIPSSSGGLSSSLVDNTYYLSRQSVPTCICTSSGGNGQPVYSHYLGGTGLGINPMWNVETGLAQNMMKPRPWGQSSLGYPLNSKCIILPPAAARSGARSSESSTGSQQSISINPGTSIIAPPISTVSQKQKLGIQIPLQVSSQTQANTQPIQVLDNFGSVSSQGKRFSRENDKPLQDDNSKNSKQELQSANSRLMSQLVSPIQDQKSNDYLPEDVSVK